MAEEGGGGTVGKLWRKHGGGFYALMAVGTFLYLDLTNLASSIASSDGVQDFVVGELLTFMLETVWYGFLASIWPVTWFLRSGVAGLLWAAGSYVVWVVVIAWALDRREKRLRRELDL